MAPFKFQRARNMRRNPTRAEAVLWLALKPRPFGVKFRRQHCMWGYIADFYSHQARLCVEVDGSSHIPALDAQRDTDLLKHGIRTIRFSNEQVLNRLDQVLERIKLGAITQPGNPASMAGNAPNDAINTA